MLYNAGNALTGKTQQMPVWLPVYRRCAHFCKLPDREK